MWEQGLCCNSTLAVCTDSCAAFSFFCITPRVAAGLLRPPRLLNGTVLALLADLVATEALVLMPLLLTADCCWCLGVSQVYLEYMLWPVAAPLMAHCLPCCVELSCVLTTRTLVCEQVVQVSTHATESNSF